MGGILLMLTVFHSDFNLSNRKAIARNYYNQFRHHIHLKSIFQEKRGIIGQTRLGGGTKMPLARVKIENFKSIKRCDISLSELNVLIGENGTGKTNILEAINYFYSNLIDSNADDYVFDENNRYSNQVRITLVYNLTEFVKISKSQSETMPDIFGDQPVEKTKYAGYYKTIISMASKSKEKLLTVELSQIRGKPIHWNYSYEDRLIFKGLFPIFHVDTRKLDVTEWGYVWDVLGELGKVSNSERKALETKINTILIDDSKEISRKLKGITEIFDASDVSVKTAMSKDFAKNLTKVFFSGDVIHQSGKQLGYYSTGTNSVKYIELLLKSIDEISRTKLKEPIVLFDEPEISLHPSYLDELSDSMIETNTKLCIVISTHSSRLIKNIITKSNDATIFNVKLIDKYSHIQRMKKFPQYSPSSKYRVTDEHINAYFSRAILFVEGETELELFSNPYLRLLFPQLKGIEVYQAMSQNPILSIMNPKLANTKTPFICLIDMDKAISYEKGTKNFVLKKEYFKSNPKEQFQYRNKHQELPYLYHQRKRIEQMQSSLKVHYYMPFVSCDDPNYHAFIGAIHQYLLQYNVFTLATTIEGALVNRRTFDYALTFLKRRTKSLEFENYEKYANNLHKTDRINSLRIVFNGKSDLLQRKAVLQKMPSNDKLILEKVMIGDKTSGWISAYLDGFFEENAQIDGIFSINSFQKYIEDKNNKKNLLKEFEYYFAELHSLIEKMCDMICQ